MADYSLTKASPSSPTITISSLTTVSVAVLGDSTIGPDDFLQIQYQKGDTSWAHIGQSLRGRDFVNIDLNAGNYRVNFVTNDSTKTCNVMVTPTA